MLWKDTQINGSGGLSGTAAAIAPAAAGRCSPGCTLWSQRGVRASGIPTPSKLVVWELPGCSCSHPSCSSGPWPLGPWSRQESCPAGCSCSHPNHDCRPAPLCGCRWPNRGCRPTHTCTLGDLVNPPCPCSLGNACFHCLALPVVCAYFNLRANSGLSQGSVTAWPGV